MTNRAHALAAVALPPRWTVIAWAMLIFGLIGGGFWVRKHAADDDARRILVSAEVPARASLARLMRCLEAPGPSGLALGSRSGTWERPDSATRAAWGRNAARHLTVSIIDRGEDRLIQIATRDRRQLRASERALLEKCRQLPPG